MRKYTYGYLYAILAAFLYALVAIVAKNLVTGGTHPFQVTFYQYLFTVLILGAWVFMRHRGAFRCGLRKLCYFAILGIVGGATTNMLFYSALQYLDAGVTSMLLFLHPVFITIFFAVTRIKKIRLINYFSVFIAACGAAIVLNVFSGTMRFSGVGIGLGILSGVTYAFYNIFADLKLKDDEPNVINFFACTASFLFSLVMLTANGIGLSIDPVAMPSVFFLAAFSGMLPAYCFFKALQYIGSEKVSVISSIELPLTLIMAFTILKEHMTAFQIFGVVLIVAATALLHWNEGKEVKKALIFDLDGTLLDSMGAWDTVALEYLNHQAINDIPSNFLELLRPLSAFDGAKYFITEFGIKLSAQQICDEINRLIEEKYKREIQPKEGVPEFLQQNINRKMCIATATDKHLVEFALKRLGLEKYFEFIITSSEVGCSKEKPDIFIKAAERLGLEAGDCVVFEDALHAIKSAKRGGFYTVGVYDKCFESEQEAIKSYADQYVCNLSEVIL